MIPLYSARQVREQDAHLINALNYPAAQLMEIAGLEMAKWIHEKDPCARVLIYCGSGNNGGDGYVIARWLKLWGHSVTCVAVQHPKTAEAALNADRLRHLDIPVISLNESEQEPPTLVVDAVLGTGQRAPLSPGITNAVKRIHDHDTPLIAVDLPTGMNPDTGESCLYLSKVFQTTFALGQHKLAHYANGKCGEIVYVDIGLELGRKTLDEEFSAQAHVLDSYDIQPPSPCHNDMVKWNRGHVAIMAGKGAAVLAAKAALCTGVGMVSVLLPKEEWGYLHSLPPEVILGEPSDLSDKRHDVLVMGPAMGFQAKDSVSRIWKSFPNPVVADADALRVIATLNGERPNYPRVITPHSAEAAALLNTSRTQVENNPFESVRKLQKFAGTALLKGPYTKIIDEFIKIVPVANFRLGVAGSGDILSGLIGGFIAKGSSVSEATTVGAWLHAHSAPKKNNGQASDILRELAYHIDLFLENN